MTRFLVHAENEVEARRLASEAGATFDVIGVSTVRDAIAAVFPDARALVRDAEHAAHVADRLYRMCFDGAPLSSWAGVAVAAEAAASQLRPGSAEARRAEQAAIIARRHQGEHIDLAWPSDEELRSLLHEDRALHLAHVVQSHIDSNAAALPEITERALIWARSVSESKGQWRLLGACGRALAALRRYDEAREILQTVVESWRRRAPAEASFALCELLRVLAIRKDSQDLGALSSTCREVAREVDPGARIFLQLAELRAGCLVGRYEAARKVVCASDGPEHALRLVQRWKARLCDATGDSAGARELRDELRKSAPHSDETMFAELDECLIAGTGIREAVEFIRAARPQAVRWLFDSTLSDEAQAIRLADEYAY